MKPFLDYWRSWFGVQRRFLIAFATIVGMTVATILWLVPAVQNIHASASVLALEVADRLRSNMGLSLGNSLGNVQSAAEQIAVEPERTSLILTRFLRDNPQFASIAVADHSGKEFIHLGKSTTSPSALRDHSRDPFFYLALQNTSNFWNVESAGGSMTHSILAVPIRTEGTVSSVIIADLVLDKVVRWGGVAPLGATGYVVDRHGVVVLSSDTVAAPLGQDIESRRIVQKVIIDGQEATGLAPGDSYLGAGGRRMFAVGLPVSVAGWGVFIEETEAHAFAGENATIALAALTWLLGMSIVLVMVRSTWRLGRLNQKLNELLKENYDVGKILVRRDIELSDANTRLMALDASKSEFVSIAAHQLRTPVTGIRWAFSMLLDQELGPVTQMQQQMLEDGLKSSIRMADLINDLLNVARIEEGRFGLELKKQPLAPLVQRTVERHRTAALGKGIALTVALPTDVPELNLDEDKMDIVLDNLIDNGIKYTPPGGSVTLTAEHRGESVRLAIRDTGIGIPKDQMEKVFEKFFRAENAQRFQTAGTGLGLYVVKNIVEGHGGSIAVLSEENAGTTFAIDLPIPKG
ncbi:MAG: sensor histidine kinase [bacterium]|nr:sensor histidine kinase [bacterium]